MCGYQSKKQCREVGSIEKESKDVGRKEGIKTGRRKRIWGLQRLLSIHRVGAV